MRWQESWLAIEWSLRCLNNRNGAIILFTIRRIVRSDSLNWFNRPYASRRSDMISHFESKVPISWKQRCNSEDINSNILIRRDPEKSQTQATLRLTFNTLVSNKKEIPVRDKRDTVNYSVYNVAFFQEEWNPFRRDFPFPIAMHRIYMYARAEFASKPCTRELPSQRQISLMSYTGCFHAQKSILRLVSSIMSCVNSLALRIARFLGAPVHGNRRLMRERQLISLDCRE